MAPPRGLRRPLPPRRRSRDARRLLRLRLRLPRGRPPARRLLLRAGGKIHPPAKPVRASAFDVARCSGLELAMAQAASLPALSDFPRLELPAASADAVPPPAFTPELDVPALPIEKVPLA